MNSFPEIIEKVCAETHVPMIQKVFGDEGVEAAFAIMATAKTLYKHIELERFSGEIVIYRLLGHSLGPESQNPEPPSDFAELANLELDELHLEVKEDGRAYRRSLSADEIKALAPSAVIYRYFQAAEVFFAGTEQKAVPRLDSSARSQFAIPTLANLREALKQYAYQDVRESTCYIFRDIWYDTNRLFVKAKSEVTMRTSLTQFLRNRIGGDHDVLPEQNVDESHPVDIRVTPRFSNNRMMLIEIKWLGFSVAEDGHITARHQNPRAQQGADQLVEYIDGQRQSAPSNVIHAYYVIIDARRENLREGDTTISRENGMYFENKELVFDPAHHESRKDFDPPYRMFARPLCEPG